MSKRTALFSPEVIVRAVRMVFEHQGENGSQYGAIRSIAVEISYLSDMLHHFATYRHFWPRFDGLEKSLVRDFLFEWVMRDFSTQFLEFRCGD